MIPGEGVEDPMIPCACVSGGGMGIRTPDPDLAKVVLYQLSYAPSRVEPGLACSQLVGLSGFEPETSRLSGVCSNQLSYKPNVGSVARRRDVRGHGPGHTGRSGIMSGSVNVCVQDTERLADRDPQQRVGYVMDPGGPHRLRGWCPVRALVRRTRCSVPSAAECRRTMATFVTHLGHLPDVSLERR